MCEIGPKHIGEFGVYDLTVDVNVDGKASCDFSNALDPVNAYLAILYSLLIILGIVVVYNLVCLALQKGYLTSIQNLTKRIRNCLNPEQVKEKIFSTVVDFYLVFYTIINNCQ